MNFPGVVDVAIGLSFVYFVFSLACSKINEGVASALRLRSIGLEMGLRKLLDGTAKGEAVPAAVADSRLNLATFKTHVQAEQATSRPPSYMRPSAFSAGVYDLLTPSVDQLLREMVPAAAANDAALTILQDPGLAFEGMAGGLVALQPPPGGDLGTLIAEAAGYLGRGNDPLAQTRAAVNNLPDGHPAKVQLIKFLKVAGTDRDKFLANLEGWFNGSMDRISGWYKRRIQIFLMVYAAVLTVAFNIDSVNMATSFYRTGPLSAAVANVAQKSTDISSAQQAIRDAVDLGLPLGWVSKNTSPAAGTSVQNVNPARQFPVPGNQVPMKVLGFLLTIGALALGSTFWFDLLGKVVNLRNAGPKPPPSPPTPPPAP